MQPPTDPFIEKRVYSVLSQNLDVPLESLSPDQKLEDLADDSIQLFELVLAFEKEFEAEVEYETLIDIETVQDVLTYVGKYYVQQS